MKRRIRAGEYAFPDNEWLRVSNEAKQLIREMLETTPEKRPTISSIMRNQWIAQYHNVPQTPLPTLDNLKEEKDNWQDVQQNMGMALGEMRVDWDKSKIKLRELPNANNPLLEKRKKKTQKDESPFQIQNINQKNQKNLNSEMIVEEISRESSVRSITPTNSRPMTPNDQMQFWTI